MMLQGEYKHAKRKINITRRQKRAVHVLVGKGCVCLWLFSGWFHHIRWKHGTVVILIWRLCGCRDVSGFRVDKGGLWWLIRCLFWYTELYFTELFSIHISDSGACRERFLCKIWRVDMKQHPCFTHTCSCASAGSLCRRQQQPNVLGFTFRMDLTLQLYFRTQSTLCVRLFLSI